MTPVRVLVVDDHPIFRMGLVAAIEHMEGVELVAEVDTAGAVEDIVETQRPDVVLLDLNLPDGSGLDVNRWLAGAHPEVNVIILTMSEDHESLLTALHDGARGYLVKGAGPERVEHAIHTVTAGDIVLAPLLVPVLADLARTRAPTRSGPFSELTAREFDVLDLMARGLDNTSIARRLVLNPKTVRNHVSMVMAKIHASDRSAAIVIARRAGLGGEVDHTPSRRLSSRWQAIDARHPSVERRQGPPAYDGNTNKGEYSIVYGTSLTVEGLSPGEHSIEAAIANADHSLTGASDEITVMVGEGAAPSGEQPAATTIDYGY